MKKFISIAIIAGSFLASAQNARKHGQGCKEDLFNVQDKQTKLWGYRNFEGEWVVPAAYIEAYQFASGKAMVKKGDKFGMVDCSGYLIINCEFDGFLEFNGDKVWARKGDKWGLINQKGQLLIAHSFDEVKKIGFDSDVAWVRKADKWGIVNEKTQKPVVAPAFSDFTIASEQVSIVKQNDSLGIIDNYSGQFIIQPKISDMEKISNRCFAYKMNGKWGAINHLGEKTIASDFDLLTKWTPGLMLAMKKGKYKVLNEKGKAISNTYDYIAPSVNDFAVFKFNNKYGYLNKVGSIAIIPKFDEARNFFFEKAIVKNNGKYQLINTKGIVSGVANLDLIERDSSKKYVVTTLNGKKQIADLSGKIALADLENVKYTDAENLIRFAKLGKWGVFDLAKNKVYINPEYNDIQYFKGDHFLLKKDNLLGVADKTGAIKIPLQYEAIDYYIVDAKPLYLVTKNSKKGLVDEKNTSIFATEYEIIAPAFNKNYVLKKDGKYGVTNAKNEEVIPFKFDYLSNIAEEPNTPTQVLVFKKGKKSGLLNYKADEIVSIAGNIKYVGEGLYAIDEGKGITLIRANGEAASKEIFEEIGNMSERMLAAKKDGKWGYVSQGAKFLIVPSFEVATPYINKLAAVKKDGKFGIIDMLGRVFENFEYDNYEIKNDKRLFFKGNETFELTKYGRLKKIE